MKKTFVGVMLIFSMLMLMSTLAFASEPRINVLTGGNNLSMPEDDLDVYNFPHTLADKGNFVIADYRDATSEYIAYAGSNWMAGINRNTSHMNNIGGAAAPIIDLGHSNGTTGIIATLGLEDDGAPKGQVLSLSARASTGSDGKALAAEVSFVDDEATDTGIGVGVDARMDRDGAFEYLIISASLASKNPQNSLSKGTGTDIEASVLLADNDMITDSVRLLYGVGLGVELLDEQTTAIAIPTHIGAEIEARKWLTLRAGGTREWRMDSWDKLATGTAMSMATPVADQTTYSVDSHISFGLALTSGDVSIDATLLKSFLQDGIVFEKGGFSSHTSVTYSF